MHPICKRRGGFCCLAVFMLIFGLSACANKPPAYETAPQAVSAPAVRLSGISSAGVVSTSASAATAASTAVAAAPPVEPGPSASPSEKPTATQAPADSPALSTRIPSAPVQKREPSASTTNEWKASATGHTAGTEPATAQSPEPPAASLAETQAEESSRFLTEYETMVAALVNAEREQKGLAPLRVTAPMRDTAHLRVVELTELYSHTRPDGTQCFTAFPKSDALGENAARGQQSPAKAMESWMASEAHRANILNPSFTQIGVGCIQEGDTLYWVQCFAA